MELEFTDGLMATHTKVNGKMEFEAAQDDLISRSKTPST